MLDVATYSAVVSLRNGRRVEIRAIRPDDHAEIVAAFERASTQSLYRRFFNSKRGFAEHEVDFFVNVEFVNHVALVAVMKEDGQPMIVGGARYVMTQPGQAELAFGVVDRNQEQGVGTALMHHLAAIAHRAELKELVADVLPENIPMLTVFEKSGFPIRTTSASGVVHVTLRLC